MVPKSLLALIIFGLLFFSCQKEEEQLFSNPTQIDTYFQLKGFVEDQIVLLTDKEVSKTASLKGKETMDIQKLDSLGWRKELDIFIQSDINKAALALSYSTEEKDNKTIHRLLPGEKGTVQEIVVRHSGDLVEEIRFTSKEENLFYYSIAEGLLKMDTEKGLLTSYQVKGSQKVWFLSPNHMEINGVIRH